MRGLDRSAIVPSVANASLPPPWDFWQSIGSPRFSVAPMVDQSELPFRMLTRAYGANLVYTPMFHSRLFDESEEYRRRNFQTCPEDRPLFAQFCGDDAATISRAARHLQDEVDAIDLNFGCPQGIARRGHYGAFLLDDRDLVESIVRDVSQQIAVPLTCKLRKVSNDYGETVNLCRRLEAAGASVLCLHGRTRDQKSRETAECDWDIIRIVKQAVHIPVIANGGIETLDDANACLAFTGADAVMSAEAVLQNPALFSGKVIPQSALASEYMSYCDRFPVDRPGIIKAHLFRILHASLGQRPDLRQRLGESSKIKELRSVADEMATFDELPLPERCSEGYYRRHRRKEAPKTSERNELFEADDECDTSLNLLFEAV